FASILFALLSTLFPSTPLFRSAIHSVVFGGFSPEAVAGRIRNCGSKTVITADEGLRGGKTIPLKKNVDAAIEQLEDGTVDHVFRSEEHTSELQSRENLVCRLLL